MTTPTFRAPSQTPPQTAPAPTTAAQVAFPASDPAEPEEGFNVPLVERATRLRPGPPVDQTSGPPPDAFAPDSRDYATALSFRERDGFRTSYYAMRYERYSYCNNPSNLKKLQATYQRGEFLRLIHESDFPVIAAIVVCELKNHSLYGTPSVTVHEQLTRLLKSLNMSPYKTPQVTTDKLRALSELGVVNVPARKHGFRALPLAFALVGVNPPRVPQACPVTQYDLRAANGDRTLVQQKAHFSDTTNDWLYNACQQYISSNDNDQHVIKYDQSKDFAYLVKLINTYEAGHRIGSAKTQSIMFGTKASLALTRLRSLEDQHLITFVSPMTFAAGDPQGQLVELLPAAYERTGIIRRRFDRALADDPDLQFFQRKAQAEGKKPEYPEPVFPDANPIPDLTVSVAAQLAPTDYMKDFGVAEPKASFVPPPSSPTPLSGDADDAAYREQLRLEDARLTALEEAAETQASPPPARSRFVPTKRSPKASGGAR